MLGKEAENLDVFRNCLNWCRKRTHTYEALFLLIILLIVVYKTVGVNPFGSSVNGAICVTSIFCIVLGWLWLRRLPRFPNEVIGILLSTEGGEDVADEVVRLEDEVRTKLKSIPLGHHFDVRRVPSHRSIRDLPTASRVREKTNAYLIVWGGYEKGKILGKDVHGFHPGKLNFTYRIPRVVPDQSQRYQADVARGLENRVWISSDQNDMIEHHFVADNIAEVAEFIIATCLLSFGKFKEARTLLADILQNHRGIWGGESATVSVQRFGENIKAKIAASYYFEGVVLYFKDVFPDGRFTFTPEILRQVIECQLQSINQKAAPEPYLQLAVLYFLVGDLQKSKKAIRKSREKWGRSSPSPFYSQGFLDAYEGNLTNAEKNYRRAFKLTPQADPQYILHLIEFAQAVVDREPNKYHLHYILGILNQELFDPVMAEKEFGKFIESNQRNNGDRAWMSKAEIHRAECIKTQGGSIEP